MQVRAFVLTASSVYPVDGTNTLRTKMMFDDLFNQTPIVETYRLQFANNFRRMLDVVSRVFSQHIEENIIIWFDLVLLIEIHHRLELLRCFELSVKVSFEVLLGNVACVCPGAAAAV